MKKTFFFFLLACFLMAPAITKADNLSDFIITDITLEDSDGLWVYFQNIGGSTVFGKLPIEIVDLDTSESYYQENEQMYWTNTTYKLYLGMLKNRNRSSYRLQAIIDTHNFFSESNENNNSLIKTFYKPVPFCTETDGGRNYDQAGSVSGIAEWGKGSPSSNFVDSCLDSLKLNEMFCGADKYVYQEAYTCPHGCSNGVCIKLPENPPVVEVKKPDLAIQNVQTIDLRKNRGQFDWRLTYEAINLGETNVNKPFKIIGKNLTNNQILGEITPDSGEFKPNVLLSSPGYYFEGKLGKEFIYGVNNIEICIDANNIISESNENNNCLTKQIDATQYNIDRSFAKRLAGKLLLGVEQGGAIWYVDLINNQRHLVTWDNAITLFQKFALGILDQDLLKIPADLSSVKAELDSDNDGYSDVIELQNNYNPYLLGGNKFKIDKKLASRLRGRFLLQVDQHGPIWYVAPNGFRYNIHWNNLMDVFTKLSLGINNSDLNKIEVAP